MAQRFVSYLKINTHLIWLSALGISGGIYVWIATAPWGIGVGYDSVFYISAADNLLDGFGLSRLDGYKNIIPLTHYPPLYPLSIAFIRFIMDFETVKVARLLNVFLYGCNVFLGGWVVIHYTRSAWAGILWSFIFFSSPILLDVHFMAMVEPLYLVLQLMVLIIINAYLRNKNKWTLLVAAALAAMAYLSRYIGISLISTCLLTLLVLRQSTWNQKLKGVVIFGLLSTLPILTWYLRNWYLTGSPTNRTLLFHPPTQNQILNGITTLSLWLLPARVPAILRGLIFVMMTIGLLIIYRKWFKHGLINGMNFIKERPLQLFVTLLTIYIIFYLLLLFISITFFDASTRLNDRILSPVYSLAVVWALIVLWNGLSLREVRWLEVGIVLLTIGFISMNFIRSQDILHEMQIEGRGFTGKDWQNSETILFVNELPKDSVIFSNEAFPIYFITGRPTNWIPEKVDVVKQQNNLNYEKRIEAMHQTIIQTGGALVVFDSIAKSNTYPPMEELVSDLILWRETTDGAVYISPYQDK